MINLIKLKRTSKIKKNGHGKHNKKHIKNHKLTKLLLHKNKVMKENSSSLQKGGNNTKEKFEVKRLTDIDYSQFSLTKYLNQDIDWGSSPGPPPTDCCIL
jgi:hypothetical protein